MMREIIQKFAHNFVMFALLLALAGTSAFAASNTRTSAPNGSAQYEAWLTNQVRHELVMLPWLSVFDNLEYRVKGNKVVLSGEVVRPILKDDAANAVKHIEGVEHRSPSGFELRQSNTPAGTSSHLWLPVAATLWIGHDAEHSNHCEEWPRNA
jgi:hypothetical protein